MQTPIAFIIFNRPDTTKRVFSEIARAKPSKLFVIADGPREDCPEDAERCAAARAIIESVDWPCEVIKNYSEMNMGCGLRPASGISWVFENVDEAIVLEDDCLPHPTFFRFCEELLEKFRADQRIMQVSGNNFQFGRKRTSYSYFFSRHNICAGAWATWARAWKYFDIAVKLWPSLRDSSWLLDILCDHRAVNYWRAKFDRAYKNEGKVDYWDYQWTFAFWSQNGLSILPNATLVSNIGFGPDATHTKNPNSPMANLPISKMLFPLEYPKYMIRNREADLFFIEQAVLPLLAPKQPSLYLKVRRKFSTLIPGPMRKALSYLRSK